MSTRVRLPDGSHVTVPTTDRAKAAEAAQKYWATKSKEKPAAKPAAKPKPKPSQGGFLDDWAGFSGRAIDNFLPNFGDELAGVGGGIGGIATGKGWGKGYELGVQDYNDRQARYKRDHPINSAIAAGTGVAGAIALPAGKVAQGASLAQRSRQAAAVGGAYGAMSGAGQGEGLVERGTNALREGAIGASVSAAFPGGAQAIQNGGRWARRNIPGVDAAYQAATALPNRITQAFTGQQARPAGVEQADRLLGEQMNRGNIATGHGRQGAPASPQEIAAEVARRNARGVPAMVGDVTEEMRGLTEYSSRGIGPGQSLVRRTLENRKANEGHRVRQHVQDTFPTAPDPIRFVEETTERAKAAAAPLYEQAYAQPVFRNAAIQGIEKTPAFRDALPQAYRNIQNQIDPATGLPKDPTALGFREMVGANPNGLPPNGPYFQTPDGRFISYENGLSAEGYDQVIRAMRDSGRQAANVNPVTGQIENTTNSVHINARGGDLRNELAAQNDPYREAVETYGDEMTQKQAFQQGNDFGNRTGPEINAQLRSMPGGPRGPAPGAPGTAIAPYGPPAGPPPSPTTQPRFAQEAFTRGAGTAMADEASRFSARFPTGDTANRVRQMIGDGPKQQALSEAQGNTGGVQDLLERLELEQQGNLTYRGVNGNSATAQRQQLDNDLDSAVGIPTSSSGIIDRIISTLADRAAPQLKQDLKERIAQVVTASDARTVQEVMLAIANQAEKDARFRKLLQQASVGAAVSYGSNLQSE
jgi:hypothetical protein